MKKHVPLLAAVGIALVIRYLELRKMRSTVAEALGAAGVDAKTSNVVVDAGRLLPFGG